MAAGEDRRYEITDLLGSHISVIQTDAELHKLSSQTFHEQNISQIPMKARCLKASQKWHDPRCTWLSLVKWLLHFTKMAVHWIYVWDRKYRKDNAGPRG